MSKDAGAPALARDDILACDERGRSAFESSAVNELFRDQPWRLHRVTKAAPGLHINVLEQQAIIDEIAYLAPKRPSTMQLFVADSRVAIGSLSKGRSSSRALNIGCRQALAVCAPFQFEPGFDFVPTRLNSMDAPSRFRELSVPSLPRPLDEEAALHLKVARLSMMPRQPRSVSEWARFVWLLGDAPTALAFAGDTAPELVSAADPLSQGYGAGGAGRGESWTPTLSDMPYKVVTASSCARSGRRAPPKRWSCWWLLPCLCSVLVQTCDAGRPQSFPIEDRPDIDLRVNRALGEAEVLRRQKCTKVFSDWLSAADDSSIEDLCKLSDHALSGKLADFGQSLYHDGSPLYILRYAILGVVDQHRWLRRSMQAAWDIVSAWQQLMPLRSHRPMPIKLLRAMASLAFMWGWSEVGLGLCVS